MWYIEIIQVNSIQVTHRDDVVATLSETLEEQLVWKTTDGVRVSVQL